MNISDKLIAELEGFHSPGFGDKVKNLARYIEEILRNDLEGDVMTIVIVESLYVDPIREEQEGQIQMDVHLSATLRFRDAQTEIEMKSEDFQGNITLEDLTVPVDELEE